MDEPNPSEFLRKVRARRRRPRHTLRRVVLWVAGVLVLLVLLSAGAGVGTVALFLKEPSRFVGCDLDSERPRARGEKSFVYARDETSMGAVPSPWNREPIPLSRMGKWLPVATVAIEDRRFWERDRAVDYEAIARAAVANVRARRTVQGGSTIQQQLVRDRYLRNPKLDLSRKLTEACLAIQLGRRMSKREILETYMNGAFYGSNAYGVEAAARTYFSRPARRLALVQAALIAGLPQAPSRFDPARHRAAAKRRRNQVLAALLDAGDITPRRYANATRRPLRLTPTRRYRRIRYPAFFEAARRELVDRYGLRRSRRGGLRVKTTIDPRLQQLGESALRSWLRLPTDPAGALVAIDPRTGAVRAMAVHAPGGRRLQFNLATQSRRQSGSTFKVFTLAAAMEAGISLGSVWRGPGSRRFTDRRCRTNNEPWVVGNYADQAQGTMSLLQATAFSVNTIYAQVALRVGLSRIVDVAHRMGIESPLLPVCSLTLGPEGVSPLEMTDAFATLAARGIRRRPQLLERVTTPNGKVVDRLRRDGRRALRRDVADRVTFALSGVVRGGTGTAAYFGRPMAGKTGTAESYKDAWFCGFVPQLAACAWIGHAQAEVPMAYVAGFPAVVGGSVPARIWRTFMAPAVGPLRARPLPTPRQSQLVVRRPKRRSAR